MGFLGSSPYGLAPLGGFGSEQLSQSKHQDHRALYPRDRYGHHCPSGGPKTQRTLGPKRGGTKPTRRQWQHRCRCGGQVDTRWLHHSDGGQHHVDGFPDVQKRDVRSGQGFRFSLDGRLRLPDAGGTPQDGHQIGG